MTGIMHAALSMSYALVVTADNVSGFASGFSPAGAVSTAGDEPTPVVTGGSGSYSYAWTQVGTPSGPFSISSAAAANPVWSDTVPAGGNAETWRLTVTDTVTLATATVIITVTLTWSDLN